MVVAGPGLHRGRIRGTPAQQPHSCWPLFEDSGLDNWNSESSPPRTGESSPPELGTEDSRMPRRKDSEFHPVGFSGHKNEYRWGRAWWEAFAMWALRPVDCCTRPAAVLGQTLL